MGAFQERLGAGSRQARAETAGPPTSTGTPRTAPHAQGPDTLWALFTLLDSGLLWSDLAILFLPFRLKLFILY